MGALMDSLQRLELSGTELVQMADFPPALAEDYLGLHDDILNIAESVETVADISPVPALATSPGIKGQIAIDASYAYFCVATDTWRRIGIVVW